MAWRFRKRIGIGPIKLNLTGKGISSVSVGGPGMTTNVPVGRNRRKPSVTYSIPGTGLSYHQALGTPQPRPHQTVEPNLEQFNANVRRAFDIAAEGQPQHMRDVIAGLVVVLTQMPGCGDSTVNNILHAKTPNVTAAEIDTAMDLFGLGMAQVQKQVDQENQQMLAQHQQQEDEAYSPANVIMAGVAGAMIGRLLPYILLGIIFGIVSIIGAIGSLMQ